jgi:N-acylneuraminate cytidylyltransferase
MSKRLLVILARGGSKRIKNKNIKNFLGKPIIFYSLNIAKKSKLFDKIHVSTESLKIYNIVNNLDCKIDFLRPKNLATDYTGSIKVLQFVFNEYKKKGEHFDELWSLSACAPLIRAKDLIKASKLLSVNKTKAVLSVAEYNAPLEWAFEFKKKSNIAELKPLNKGAFSIRSQDLKKKYYDTGSFFCIKKKYLNKITSLDELYSGVVIPKSRAADIDEEDDWNLAETLYKGLSK